MQAPLKVRTCTGHRKNQQTWRTDLIFKRSLEWLKSLNVAGGKKQKTKPKQNKKHTHTKHPPQQIFITFLGSTAHPIYVHSILWFHQLLEDHAAGRTSLVDLVKNQKEIKFVQALATLISNLLSGLLQTVKAFRLLLQGNLGTDFLGSQYSLSSKQKLWAGNLKVSRFYQLLCLAQHFIV